MARSRAATTLVPFLLTAAVMISDQVSKLAVLRNIPRGRIAWKAFGDFFWLVHNRNLGAAFSMGDSMSALPRIAVLILLPLALLAGLVVFSLKTDEFTGGQRWGIALIVGGGLGNLVDRVFRPEGVVDFLSFRFYGLFGMERFPTFNIADSAIVIGAFVVIAAGLLASRRDGT